MEPKGYIVPLLEKDISNKFILEITSNIDIGGYLHKVVKQAIDKHYTNINTKSVEDSVAAACLFTTAVSAIKSVNAEIIDTKIYRSIAFTITQFMLDQKTELPSIVLGLLYETIQLSSWSESQLQLSLQGVTEGMFMAVNDKVKTQVFKELVTSKREQIHIYFSEPIQHLTTKIIGSVDYDEVGRYSKYEDFID